VKVPDQQNKPCKAAERKTTSWITASTKAIHGSKASFCRPNHMLERTANHAEDLCSRKKSVPQVHSDSIRVIGVSNPVKPDVCRKGL